MLFVVQQADKPQPLFRCGICDKPIEHASSGVVVFPRGLEPGERYRVLLVHKGSCNEAALPIVETDQGPPVSMDLAEYLRRFLSEDSGERTAV